jgi:hypothetical protein
MFLPGPNAIHVAASSTLASVGSPAVDQGFVHVLKDCADGCEKTIVDFPRLFPPKKNYEELAYIVFTITSYLG